jgi:hypothetical protein
MAKKNERRVSKPSSLTTGSRLAEPIFNPDYSYVKNDLRRIGILAGSIFAGLIVLYFLMPLIFPLYY